MAIPATMSCVEITTPGGPEVLKPATRPTPKPGEGEVLIQVAAAGVNRPDVLQRKGAYPSPAGAPANPGLEAAGTVVAVGRNVREFKAGDRVCALLQGGGYSEYCAVNAGQVLPIPGSLGFIEYDDVFGRRTIRVANSVLVEEFVNVLHQRRDPARSVPGPSFSVAKISYQRLPNNLDQGSIA